MPRSVREGARCAGPSEGTLHDAAIDAQRLKPAPAAMLDALAGSGGALDVDAGEGGGAP